MLVDFELVELHSSEFVANRMSHNKQNQTTVSYRSHYITNQKQVAVALYFSLACSSNIGDVVIHSKMTVKCKTKIFYRLREIINFTINL